MELITALFVGTLCVSNIAINEQTVLNDAIFDRINSVMRKKGSDIFTTNKIWIG